MICPTVPLGSEEPYECAVMKCSRNRSKEVVLEAF